MNNNVFGLGFLDRNPSTFGARVASRTARPKLLWKTASGLRVAVIAMGIATMISVPLSINASTPSLSLHQRSSMSTSIGTIIPIQSSDFKRNSWDYYLDNIRTSGHFSEKHIDFVRDFVLYLREKIDADVPFPRTGPTPDGNFQLVWDSGINHVDVDVYPDGTFEWFYNNRETKDFSGNEGCHLDNFPNELTQHISRIISKNNNISKNEN